MFESSPVAGILTDAAGNVLLANSEAESLFGLQGRFPGMAIAAILTKSKDGHSAKHADGSTFPVEVKQSRLESGNDTYTFTTVSDISTTNKLIFDLTERVKEQKTLLQITELLFRSEDPKTIFTESVALIREGWQYPEHTQVCIELADGSRFITDGFCETKWLLSSPITLNNQDYGLLSVCYDTEFPLNIESKSVFLDEEQRLIDTLAKLFSIFLHQRTALQKMQDSQALVSKVTALSPVNTYQFELDQDGKIDFHFASRGFSFRNIGFSADEIMDDPEKLLSLIHADDRKRFDEALVEAYKNLNDINIQYRVVIGDSESWRWLRATNEQAEDGRIIWYGSTQDITQIVAYINILEEILFDISHVLRKPVSSMLGLTEYLASHDNLSGTTIKDFAGHLRTVSIEMDDYIKQLNDAYHQKRLSLAMESLAEFQHLLTVSKKFNR